MKGDVNGNGVVNKQNIADILTIMKNGGETADAKYYRYVVAMTEEVFRPPIMGGGDARRVEGYDNIGCGSV